MGHYCDYSCQKCFLFFASPVPWTAVFLLPLWRLPLHRLSRLQICCLLPWAFFLPALHPVLQGHLALSPGFNHHSFARDCQLLCVAQSILFPYSAPPGGSCVHKSKIFSISLTLFSPSPAVLSVSYINQKKLDGPGLIPHGPSTTKSHCFYLLNSAHTHSLPSIPVATALDQPAILFAWANARTD